jgi:proline iminopeptidase
MKIKVFLLATSIISILFVGCEKEMNINEAGNLVPKTVDQDQSLPSISVNGTQLHAETFGNPDSSMVIFLHGGPGADYRNGLAVKQLADNGYYVVFYDQRGSGLSKRHNRKSISIQQMFDDLTAVIQNYRTSPTQKVFLFGHSWGAILAAGYINQNPTKINGAIFAEPGGFTWANIQQYGERTRKLELFSEGTNDALYADQFLTGKENEHEILDYKLNISSSFTYQKGNAEGIEAASPMWRNGFVMVNTLYKIAQKDGFDFTTNLNQYSTKVLFLYGELNTAYGLEFAEKEAKYFQNTQITQINGTGHEMIYFKWNNVYPVVLTYLNSLN